MNTLKQVYYIFFELKNGIYFKSLYFLEKIMRYIFLFLNKVLGTNYNIPYLIHQDYIIQNKNGNFFCKAHTDHDFIINSYFEQELEPYFGKKYDYFIDIGAHIGKWTVFVARENPETTIISIEPNPETFEYLKRNINHNNILNITCLQVALGATDSTSIFISDTIKTAMSGVISDVSKDLRNQNCFQVQVLTVDSVMKSNNVRKDAYILIKIDIEGYEEELFKGMIETLNVYKRLEIIVEIFDIDRRRRIEDMFQKFGMKLTTLPTITDILIHR